MVTLYKEDMAKALEVMARRQGLSTSYDDISESGRAKHSKQQNLSRKKRLCNETDDAGGPPDTKTKFQSGIELTWYISHSIPQHSTCILQIQHHVEEKQCQNNVA